MTVRTHILSTALIVFLLGFPLSVLADRISGTDYLARVNAQRQARGQGVLPSTDADKLVTYIDGLSVEQNEFLQKRNAANLYVADSFDLISQIVRQSTIDPNTQTPDPNKNQYAGANAVDAKQAKSCISASLSVNLDVCWKWFMSTMGQVFLAAGAQILLGASYLFDLLVQNVIVNFQAVIGPGSTNIIEAIKVGWTILRDLANIMIIGMFIFIAVSLILGLKEFGQKKLIANVLIVAVLLNFSLLFTQLAIDASNFISFQFYKGMARTDPNNQDFSVGQAFLKPMGITSVWQHSGDLTKRYANGTDSGWMAFFFGLLGGILLFTVAVVILYGCFLIAARGVLLLVLMVLSAPAFATYLIPKLSDSQYGFKNWLKVLFNSAIFAPLLMLSLAISLTIVNIAQPKAGGTVAALGSIAGDPGSVLTSADGFRTILVYILGTGFLFLSFRLSSKFAGSVSGFNLGDVASLAVAGFAGRATAGAAGATARQTAGRIAFDRSQSLQDRARKANLEAAFQNREVARHTQALNEARRTGNTTAESAALRDISLAKSRAQRELANAAKFARQSDAQREKAGRTYSLADGTKTKSFLQQREETAKKAAKIAEIARPGEAEQKKIAEQVTNEARDAQKAALSRAEASKKAAEESYAQLDQSLSSTKARFDQEKQNAEQALAVANQAQATLISRHRQDEDVLLNDIENARDEATKNTLRNQLASLKTEHETRRKRVDQDVAEKEAAVKDVAARRKTEVEDKLEAAQNVTKEADKQITTINERIESINEGNDSATNRKIEAYKTDAKRTTAEVAARVGNKLGGVLNDGKVAELARSYSNKQVGQGARMRDFLKEIGANTDNNVNPGGNTNPKP